MITVTGRRAMSILVPVVDGLAQCKKPSAMAEEMVFIKKQNDNYIKPINKAATMALCVLKLLDE